MGERDRRCVQQDMVGAGAVAACLAAAAAAAAYSPPSVVGSFANSLYPALVSPARLHQRCQPR